MNRAFGLALLFVSVAPFGCKNPASNKPAAEVREAVAEVARRPANAPRSLAISQTDSKIEFVGSKVTGSHNGGFARFTGNIDFGAETKPESARVIVDIDATSAWTDTEKLTGHLKSADFLDVAKFPKATFVTTEIKPAIDGGTATHTVTGNLDLHGVKKSISFPANISVAADAVSASAEFSINRKDFGIVYPGMPDNLIRDLVLIRLSLKASRR